jgi:hypothetical protein
MTRIWCVLEGAGSAEFELPQAPAKGDEIQYGDRTVVVHSVKWKSDNVRRNFDAQVLIQVGYPMKEILDVADIFAEANGYVLDELPQMRRAFYRQKAKKALDAARLGDGQ